MHTFGFAESSLVAGFSLVMVDGGCSRVAAHKLLTALFPPVAKQRLQGS